MMNRKAATSAFVIAFVVVVALLMFFDVEFLMYYPESQKHVVITMKIPLFVCLLV